MNRRRPAFEAIVWSLHLSARLPLTLSDIRAARKACRRRSCPSAASSNPSSSTCSLVDALCHWSDRIGALHAEPAPKALGILGTNAHVCTNSYMTGRACGDATRRAGGSRAALRMRTASSRLWAHRPSAAPDLRWMAVTHVFQIVLEYSVRPPIEDEVVVEVVVGPCAFCFATCIGIAHGVECPVG